MSTEKTERDQIIAGYRELLDFAEIHPDLPLGRSELNSFCVLADNDDTGRAEIERIAAILQAPANLAGSQPSVRRVFGAITYTAFYCTRQSMKDHDFVMRVGREALHSQREGGESDV